MKRLATVALVAALLAGCSDDGGGSGASAFTVELPGDFHLLAEGRGENGLLWGSDTDGYSTGGFVVLARSDDAEDQADLAVVEVTGFQGFEGGLSQAIDSHPSTGGEELEVDGRPALVAPLDDGVTQVVAVRRDDLAISAQSSALTVDQLVDLIRDTDVPAGRPPTGAPEVDPPEGWVVLGRATSDLTIALGAFSAAGYAGGPAVAQSSAWRSPVSNQVVTVMTLPAAAGDLDAAVGFSLTKGGDRAIEADRFTLDGRPAVWLSTVSRRGTIATTTGWGDLLVVRSATAGVGAPEPDRELLSEVASSVAER